VLLYSFFHNITPIQSKLFENASFIVNSFSLNDSKFFISAILRAYFTKLFTQSARSTNNLSKLSDMDQIIDIFISKFSDPKFLNSILDSINSHAPLTDDFFLEELIPHDDISSYISNAIAEATPEGDL
jgi:hypothetical protein